MAESGNDIVEFTQDGNTRWAARDSKAYQRYLKEQKQAPQTQQTPNQAVSPPPVQQAPQTETPQVQQAPQTEQPPQAQVGGKPKA